MGTSTHAYDHSLGYTETGGCPKASWPVRLRKVEIVTSRLHKKAVLKRENNNVDSD